MCVVAYLPIDPFVKEAAHALGDKHSGLATTLEKGGVRELHDISGLKHSLQVSLAW